MQYFAKLFTKVPFDLLEIHMEKVFTCLLLLKKMLLMAYAIKKEDAWDFYAEDIANIGHEADLVKNDIRVALPHSSSSTRALLEILTIQDDLADTAEESSSLLIMKSLSFPQEVKADFFDYVAKNIEAATLVKDIVFKLDACLVVTIYFLIMRDEG